MAHLDEKGWLEITTLALDERDLPVHEPYLESLAATGAVIRGSSRWLNATSVIATPAQLAAITELPFVKKLRPVATYKRKKDSKKGYYISYWTFNPKRIKDLVVNMRISKLDKLRERLTKEEQNQNGFFMCPDTCVRLDFDSATELGFRCPECGSLLMQQDNARTIDHLRERIKEIEAVA